MAHKDDYKLYLISRKHAGSILGPSDLLEYFGYSQKTNIIDTRVMKYVVRLTHYSSKNQIYEVMNYAAVPMKIILEYNIGVNKNKRIHYKKISKKDLYLVPRKLVPFWLLKEYGGDIE